MIRVVNRSTTVPSRIPRESGDDPVADLIGITTPQYSPRERG